MSTNKEKIERLVEQLQTRENYYNKYRKAGYVEALLQVEGYIDLYSELPYKTKEVKCGWFWRNTKTVRAEIYPDLIIRLAKDFLKTRREEKINEQST